MIKPEYQSEARSLGLKMESCGSGFKVVARGQCIGFFTVSKREKSVLPQLRECLLRENALRFSRLLKKARSVTFTACQRPALPPRRKISERFRGRLLAMGKVIR